MSEPTTEAGRALLEMEAYNSRSFPIVTAERILAIEQEAAAAERAKTAALDVERLAFADGLALGIAADPDRSLLVRGVHKWFCGATVKHGDKGRPHIGWACERGAVAIRAAIKEASEKEWCLHCGSDTCEHATQHNTAYGKAAQ